MSKIIRVRVLIYGALAYLLFSSPAYANAGLPMIVIMWPIFWLALLPIILIEAFAMKAQLQGITFTNLLKAVTAANLISTLVGIPFVWGTMVAIELMVPGGGSPYDSLGPFWQYFLGVTLQAAWLIPYEDQFYWMIPTAFMVLLVPCFYMSYMSERIVNLSMLEGKGAENEYIGKATFKANCYSYGFLLLLGLLSLGYCYFF